GGGDAGRCSGNGRRNRDRRRRGSATRGSGGVGGERPEGSEGTADDLQRGSGLQQTPSLPRLESALPTLCTSPHRRGVIDGRGSDSQVRCHGEADTRNCRTRQGIGKGRQGVGD
ncbi:unnamed protein product, partial [Ectocarpus sp. 13 AM-2016]